MNAQRIFIASGIFLLGIAMFGLGMVTVHRNWAIWKDTAQIKDMVRSVLETGANLPSRSYYRRAESAPDQRYVVTDKDAIADGYWAITRIDPETGLFTVDLLAVDGTIAHSWATDYSDIMPSGSDQTFLHGANVQKDGSILVAYDGGTGLARLDSCGQPLWARTDAFYHHVIQTDATGFWTWRAPAHANGDDQRLFRFDGATGQTLETIDLIDDVVAVSPANALITSIPKGYEFTRDTWNWNMTDLFHPNDLEPLTAEMADAFPQFSPGDLLVSLRNINLVAVIDRKTREILWSAGGPWREQHDPDWQADGTITVYNNNVGRGRSNIVRVDPKTNAASVLFDGDGPQYYSNVMGQHQLLPNGNWLILSPTEGRIMEVTANGEPVREYSNIINDRFNAIVPNVQFIPADYFDTFPTCAAKGT
jgi:Arylsulfotransferase (ASST)